MSETTLTEKPPISIWKRLLLGSGVFVLLLMAGSIGQYSLQRSRSAGVLEKVVTDLDEIDPGWRLEDIEAARPSIPDAGNSALTLLATQRLVPMGALNNKVMKPFNQLPPLPQLLDAERAGLLERELKTVDAALWEAHKLARMPVGRHLLVHSSNPMATLLPHAQETWEVTRLLQLDALRLAQKGDARESLRSCQAALNAARSLDDEPFIVSQLVRVACVGVVGGAIERTLSLGEPPLEDLASLQKLVEQEETHPTLLVGLRGERALHHQIMIGLADGSIPTVGFFDRGFDWKERLALWDIKGMARREHPQVLELMGRAIDNARLPSHEQAAAEKRLQAEITALPKTSIARRLLPAADKFAEATRRKLAQVRCLKVVLAVERYRREKGAWPANLRELTPKLLAAVPSDPFDGKPLRYRRLADGVVVYSIGSDGKDDGGSIRLTGRVPRAADLGYQLWDVRHRRQPPKTPAPKPK